MGNGSLLNMLNYMCFQEGTFFSFNFLTLIDKFKLWQDVILNLTRKDIILGHLMKKIIISGKR